MRQRLVDEKVMPNLANLELACGKPVSSSEVIRLNLSKAWTDFMDENAHNHSRLRGVFQVYKVEADSIASLMNFVAGKPSALDGVFAGAVPYEMMAGRAVNHILHTSTYAPHAPHITLRFNHEPHIKTPPVAGLGNLSSIKAQPA